MIENLKNILMLFHTSLRNMGLFITITLASLVGWRFWRFRDKQLFKNIDKIFLVVSIMTSIVSIYIGYNTSKHIQKVKNKNNNLHHKLYIIYLIMSVAIILLGYSMILLTLY